MEPAPRPAALTALRQATAASHGAIETLLRLDAQIDAGRYGAILSGFDVFLSAWEPAVMAALPERRHAWFLARSRRAFLHQDLATLGLDRAAAGVAALPLLPSRAAAFGSMYVIEGSALGGQVIARQLADRFGNAHATGAAYFHGWGEQTGRLWREFCECLDIEIGSAPVDIEAACVAAVQTFDALATTVRARLDEPLALAA